MKEVAARIPGVRVVRCENLMKRPPTWVHRTHGRISYPFACSVHNNKQHTCLLDASTYP